MCEASYLEQTSALSETEGAASGRGWPRKCDDSSPYLLDLMQLTQKFLSSYTNPVVDVICLLA